MRIEKTLWLLLICGSAAYSKGVSRKEVEKILESVQDSVRKKQLIPESEMGTSPCRAFVEGDFNEDGKPDIALAAFIPAEKTTESQVGREGFYLILTQESGKNWRVVFTRKVITGTPCVIWGKEQKRILLSANFTDNYDKGDVVWDPRSSGYRYVEPRYDNE